MYTLDPDDVRERFAGVTPALHRCVSDGVQAAAKMATDHDLDGPRYTYFRTHAVRAVAHRKFTKEVLTDTAGWRPCGKHERNGHFAITKDLWTARLLHSKDPKAVPAPGPNGGRRAFYTNPPLFEQVPAQAMLPRQDFLLLWRVDPVTEEVLLRLVHPLSPWPYRGPVRADLSMPLLIDTDEMRKLRFEPEDPGLGDIVIDDEVQEDQDGDGFFA